MHEKVGDKLKGRIEQGIPVPKKMGLLLNEFHEVLDSMKIKESILCTGHEISRCQFAINSIHRGKTGKRYTGRQLGKDKKRYWRTE